jgi:hypothetical protein
MRFLNAQYTNKNTQTRRGESISLLIVILTLAACGGGGGGGTATPVVQTPMIDNPQPTTVTISGTVAKGAAFAGASVVATNSSGALNTPVIVAPDGTYSIVLPIDVKVPIVLTASKASTTGEVESFSTIIADKANTLANITPITNVIAALLSSNGNPDQLAAQVSGGAAITQTTLSAKTLAVQNVLKSAIDALGVAAIDPIKSSFAANSAGYGKLLESISTTIIANGSVANIEIALRTKATSDSAQPPNALFASNQASLPALPPVVAASFIADGMSAKLAQLMADAQGCYALALNNRISAVPANATAVVGVPADIAAPLCKGIFFENNPSGYLNSSVKVGRDTSGFGAFSALYESTTGIKFDSAQYEYTLANGDIGVSFRTTLPGATPTVSANTLRLDPADQKLKFIGDQYQYSGRVLPVMQKREFSVLNQSQWDYLSTGYTVSVGNPRLFEKVDVIAPNGVTYKLVPNGSLLSSLSFEGKGTSNYLRLRTEFVDLTKTYTVASKLKNESIELGFETTELSDQVIASFPGQAVWTLRYFKVGNKGTAPDAVHTYRTRGRALTISELRGKPRASASVLTTGGWASTALAATGQLPLSTTSPFTITWTVPSGSVPPISVNVFGKYRTSSAAALDGSFSDFTIFAPTNLSTSVPCGTVSGGSFHCAGGTNGGYKAGSEATGLYLVGVDLFDRNFGTQYGFTSLTIEP